MLKLTVGRGSKKIRDSSSTADVIVMVRVDTDHLRLRSDTFPIADTGKSGERGT